MKDEELNLEEIEVSYTLGGPVITLKRVVCLRVYFHRIKKDEGQGKEGVTLKLFVVYYINQCVCLFATGLKKTRSEGKKMSH